MHDTPLHVERLADLIEDANGFASVVYRGEEMFPIRMPGGSIGYSSRAPRSDMNDYLIDADGVVKTTAVRVNLAPQD